MNDPFVVAARGQICFDQCILELPQASGHVAAIGVDCYDKRALSSCRATPVRRNGGRVTLPDPLLAAAPSNGEIFKIEIVIRVAEPLHILLDESLMAPVLRKDYNPRRSTQAPIRELPAPLERDGFSGRHESLQPERVQWHRERIVCHNKEPTD